MKLRRFVGETSRAVLDQVRAVFGPDAIIVANRATSAGIEITAVSGDAIAGLLDERPPAAARVPAAAPSPAIAAAEADDGVRVTLSTTRGAALSADNPAPQVNAVVEHAAHPVAASPAAEPSLSERLSEEVAAMRKLLTEQIEQLTLTDALKRSPLRARALRELLQAGYSPALARPLVQRIPDDFTAEQAGSWVRDALARSLGCIDPAHELVTRGGVYALVGPTGVGKTTTTAKLAARCAVRYGASSLALLTTDSYRVGGHDQLRIYARILGVTVQTVADRADLRHALETARGKHLVLIDTVGMGQRDRRVDEQVALLNEPGVRRVLLLNAAAQAETLDEVVCRYNQPLEPGATPSTDAIITKLDEAARVGAVLDVAIRHQLVVQHLTNGQRVPEDLVPARADYLVDRSLRSLCKTTPFTFGADELALLAAMPGAGHA